jgi:hypothetical protein
MGSSPVTSVDALYKAAAVPRLILLVPRLGGELVPNQNESSNRVRCTRPSEWFDGLGQAVGLEPRPSAFRPRIDQARYRQACDATRILGKAAAGRQTSKGTGASRAYNGPKALVKSSVTLCSDIACIQLRSAPSDRGPLRTETGALVRCHTIALPASSSVSETYISRASSGKNPHLPRSRSAWRIVVPPRRQHRDS